MSAYPTSTQQWKSGITSNDRHFFAPPRNAPTIKSRMKTQRIVGRVWSERLFASVRSSRSAGAPLGSLCCSQFEQGVAHDLKRSLIRLVAMFDERQRAS